MKVVKQSDRVACSTSADFRFRSITSIFRNRTADGPRPTNRAVATRLHGIAHRRVMPAIWPCLECGSVAAALLCPWFRAHIVRSQSEWRELCSRTPRRFAPGRWPSSKPLSPPSGTCITLVTMYALVSWFLPLVLPPSAAFCRKSRRRASAASGRCVSGAQRAPRQN